MKKIFSIALISIAALFNSCINGQAPTSTFKLPAKEFAEKIKALPSPVILDVRTPEEYSKGHLRDAKNINWNGNKFNEQVSQLDKTKPVFVYCHSGARSAAAANKLRSEGFRKVYELEGGIMKWRAADLPETKENTAASTGMTTKEFNELLISEKLILIDFYADWCAPCKKMKPYLDEISKDMSEKVQVIRINADDNQALCKELKIAALPVLQLYKNKNLAWTNTGYIEKSEVVRQLQ